MMSFFSLRIQLCISITVMRLWNTFLKKKKPFLSPVYKIYKAQRLIINYTWWIFQNINEKLSNVIYVLQFLWWFSLVMQMTKYKDSSEVLTFSTWNYCINIFNSQDIPNFNVYLVLPWNIDYKFSQNPSYKCI